MTNEHTQQAFNVLAETPLKNLDVNWRDQRPHLTPEKNYEALRSHFDTEYKAILRAFTNVFASGQVQLRAPSPAKLQSRRRSRSCTVERNSAFMLLFVVQNQWLLLHSTRKETPKTLEDRPGRWMPCLLSRSMKLKLLARHVFVALS